MGTGDGVEYTGRTAVRRDERYARSREGIEDRFGRETPQERHLPSARLVEFEVLSATEDSDVSVAAASLSTVWTTWKQAASRERYRIWDATFEHYLNSGGLHGFLLYLTYSK